jgi:multidrug efflux pump subunit AcrA (membrane-fusion protein)
MYVHDVSHPKEILVQAGDEIKAGELIAQLNDPKASERQSEKQTLETQISAALAKTDALSVLLLTEMRKRLKEIATEDEKSKIYTPVNARVLLIRTHAIHNGKRTVAIKLLVHE